MSAAQGTMLGLPLKRDKPLLMIMDGHAMVHRAFRGIAAGQNLVTRHGEDTTAVYGFSNTFLRAIQDLEPTHCVIAFDTPQPTFRHEMFAEYKAQRPPTPPELRKQFDRVKQLMAAFNVPRLEAPGFEADDILGTLAREAERQDVETIILTGDSDILQLVSPNVRVQLFSAFKAPRIYDETAVRKRYGGLVPTAHPDFKAIKGDPSDNIPGVPGLGEKTAIKLLLQFPSLEAIYEHIDEVKPPRTQKLLRENKDAALQGKVLTTIRRDAPVSLDLDECRFWNYDRDDVVNILRELEFASVVARVPHANGELSSGSASKKDEGPPKDYVCVNTREALDRMIDSLHEAGQFAFDTETTSINPMTSELVGLSFSTAPGKAWYVPVGHQKGKQLPLEETLAALKPLLEDPQLKKCGHNLNYDVTALGNYGIQVRGMACDTMMAAYLLGIKAIGLKNLALDVFNFEMTPIKTLIGTGRKQKSMDQVPIEDVVDYACADADYSGRLRPILEKRLRDQGFWTSSTRWKCPS